MQIPDVTDVVRLECDVLVIGGGTAGTMAALTAAEHGAQVLLLEKAHVRHSGALAMGMDGVNSTAVSTLIEHLPDGYEAAVRDALRDDDREVRRVAADAVRELVEVLFDPEPIAGQLSSIDPAVRAVAVYLLSARRVGDPGEYRRALADTDHRVRIEAVRALVSVDDAAGVATATRDDNREVRIAAANGLATLRTGADAVRELVGDRKLIERLLVS